MKKDITIPEVKNVHVAVVNESLGEGESGWNVYLINDLNEIIEGVMVTSSGYSDELKKVKTSVLRHMVGNIPAKTAAKIEPISETVFEINNEYWVTFFSGNKLMEKKFVFGPHTITKVLEEELPVMNCKGVIIW